MPLHLLVALLYTITQCNALACGKPSCGPCSADGLCTLNCDSSNYQCQNSHLTCKDEEDCTIKCKNPFTGVCQGATIDASNAINVDIDCDWTDSCRTTDVTCGTGDCIITCDQDHSCQTMVVDATETHGKLQINCWLTNSCSGIDVQCGDGLCYMNCGGSKNGLGHCTNMKLKCGTGDCRINCQDEGYRQCEGISIDITLAKSFECIGDSVECASAPQPFTAVPTTPIPTSFPSTSQPTTTQPTTHQPTTHQPTTASVSISVEIPISATNVTNATIEHTFTGIINNYLVTHLEVTGNFSLSVDVIQNNRVIVTVSTKDIAEFNQTQLVSYINSQLQNTNIRIIDPNIATTKIDELIATGTDEDNEVLIIIYVLVIIVIVLAIGVLIIAIVWHKRKQNHKNDLDKKTFSVLECSPQSPGEGCIQLIATKDGSMPVTSNSNICDIGENDDDMYNEHNDDDDDIHNTPKDTPKIPTLNDGKGSIDTPTLNGIRENVGSMNVIDI